MILIEKVRISFENLCPCLITCRPVPTVIPSLASVIIICVCFFSICISIRVEIVLVSVSCLTLVFTKKLLLSAKWFVKFFISMTKIFILVFIVQHVSWFTTHKAYHLFVLLYRPSLMCDWPSILYIAKSCFFIHCFFYFAIVISKVTINLSFL